jgi:hypothetical protein
MADNVCLPTFRDLSHMPAILPTDAIALVVKGTCLASSARIRWGCSTSVRLPRVYPTNTQIRHHFVEGLPPPVIAARYGVSRQAVGKALKRFEMAIERMHKAVANGASSTQ